MIEVLVIPLLVLGSLLMLLAGVGLVRMPDLFTRMHAATKSATLGVGFVMLGVAIFYGELGISTRALLVILFFLLTAPIGAHLIGRAGYMVGVELWEGTKWDELRDKYDHQTHTLNSPASQAELRKRSSAAQQSLDAQENDDSH